MSRKYSLRTNDEHLNNLFWRKKNHSTLTTLSHDFDKEFWEITECYKGFLYYDLLHQDNTLLRANLFSVVVMSSMLHGCIPTRQLPSCSRQQSFTNQRLCKAQCRFAHQPWCESLQEHFFFNIYNFSFFILLYSIILLIANYCFMSCANLL